MERYEGDWHMKRSRKEIRRMRILVFGAAVIVIAAAILILGRIKENQPDRYDKNQKKLEKLQKADISETEKQWEKLEKQTEKTEIDDSKRNGYGIVELDSVTLKKVFANTLVVGDSFTEAAVGYGILDEGSAIYKRGASVNGIDELVKKVIAMKPSSVVMEFGSNDLTMYGTNVDGFIKKYRSQIREIRKALPDTAIYVNSILPMTEEKTQEEEGRKKRPEYNAAIENMCDEEGYMYIDSCFIVEQNPELFEPDGIHMVKEYYTQWLSYLVEKAGL